MSSISPPYVHTNEPIVNRLLRFAHLLKTVLLHEANVYKAWEEDRAALSYGFAQWMVVLWRTKWTSRPCCCGIRFQTIAESGKRIHTFSSDEHVCDRKTLEEQRLLLIGLGLAELAVAAPIRLRDCAASPNAEPLIEMMDVATGTWQSKSTTQIIKEVRNGVHRSESFVDAVRYCLRERTKASMKDVRPGHLSEFCEKILEP